MSESKAEALEKKAEAALKPGFFGFLGSDTQRAEDAAGFYSQAAAQYKMLSELVRAGDLFVKTAEMYERANSSTKVAEAYKEACTLYKQGGDSKKAIQYNTILARLYEEKNRTSQAGKVYDALAELYVDRNQIPDAIVAYENSLRCRTILDQVVHQNEIKLKLADVCANNSRYEKAIELFEEIAEPVKGRTNYSAPGYYWKAVLCRMRLEVEATAEIQQSQDDFLRYQELCPHFNQGATRRSCALLASLYEEFKKESVDGFEAALQTYRANGGVLSAWDVDMLTAVKNSLETPVIKTPEPQGGQPDSDDDFT